MNASPQNSRPSSSDRRPFRSLASLSGARPQPGTGILRPFPSAELPHIDPFVFLDTGEPQNLGSRDIFVGPHPHRGVQPVSLLFKGRIEHRDSLGNERSVDSGGMQWLVSGRGALHEEVLAGDEQGTFHMAQLWINVPASLKLAAPEHHAVPARRVPELESLGKGSKIRLYAGTLAGHTGPAPMPTPVVVAHLQLDPGGEVTVPVDSTWNAAFTVVEGQLQIDGAERSLQPGDTPVFQKDGEAIRVRSEGGGQAVLMFGEPIDEPMAFGGGFVMNTADEIETAFDDYRSGKMGTLVASR